MRTYDKHNVGRDRQFRRWVVTLWVGKISRKVLVSAPDADRAIGTALSISMVGNRQDASARLATAADLAG